MNLKENYFKKMDFKIDNKKLLFIKFLLVGGLNTVFGYSVYAILLFVGLHFSVAAFFSTIAGILFNFKTTGYLVFKNTDNRLIFRFFGTYFIVYLLNVFFLKIMKSININLYIGGLALLLPMALVSFWLMKKFVFKDYGSLN